MYLITEEKIKTLVSELIKTKWNIVSESPKGTNFIYINDGKDVVLNSESRPTKLSMKDFYFPKTEPLFFYKKTIDNIEIIDPKDFSNRTVIFGAKPCDAAAIPAMSKVMNWDYQDEFFNKRVENLVIIGLSCNYEDEYCFCNSVGLSPDSEKGSDIFLRAAGTGSYSVTVVTEKGKGFVEEYNQFFEKTEKIDLTEKQRKNKQRTFEYNDVKSWLDKNFKSDYWEELGEICFGCAQCAYVCPTCHCFDIVDEECKLDCGRRMKNWDACQFSLFTKHASGHNPRDGQAERYRQRISHKFKYYKEKFDEVLCTGCGRCSRGCSVGIDLGEILQHIDSKQKQITQV